MSRIFNMTQNSMNTPYAKRVAEKFREAQNYLKKLLSKALDFPK